MSAQIIRFPLRSPLLVYVEREDDLAWLVRVRSHGWLFGSRREALAEARDLANSFDVICREVRQ